MFFGVVTLTVIGCGIDNALVGGRCQDAFELRGDSCVARGAPAGSVIATTDPPPDAPIPVVFGPDATTFDATTFDASNDTGVDASFDATLDAAVDSGSDAGLDASTDAAAPPLDAAPDALTCSSPLVLCRGACIPVDTDGANCGACGKICPSNICVAGECQGATPGDVILIGHDYASAPIQSAQAKVLLNAVSIPTTDPIRILSYDIGADPASVADAHGIVTAGVRGRSVSFSPATDADLMSPSLAQSYDVVLIHDGAGAGAAALGQSWKAALVAFAQKGGVVVALDGAHAHAPELVTGAELFSVASHTTLPGGSHLIVAAPSDVVGSQVLSPYASFGTSVSFAATLDADTTVVVRDETTTLPVVLHRVVR